MKDGMFVHPVKLRRSATGHEIQQTEHFTASAVDRRTD